MYKAINQKYARIVEHTLLHLPFSPLFLAKACMSPMLATHTVWSVWSPPNRIQSSHHTRTAQRQKRGGTKTCVEKEIVSGVWSCAAFFIKCDPQQKIHVNNIYIEWPPEGWAQHISTPPPPQSPPQPHVAKLCIYNVYMQSGYFCLTLHGMLVLGIFARSVTHMADRCMSDRSATIQCTHTSGHKDRYSECDFIRNLSTEYEQLIDRLLSPWLLYVIIEKIVVCS